MVPSVDQIALFLADRYGYVDDVVVLQAGAWSSAYAFVADGRELVVRIGPHRADFDKERIAATWCEPGLPVPDVLDVGDAFDAHYIVSERRHGTKLADLPSSRVPAAMGHLFEVLAAMRRVDLPGIGYGIWQAPDTSAPASTWAEYLCGVSERDEQRLVDWRRKLSLHPRANDAFRWGCSTLEANAHDLPTVRMLVHADLLLNHLVGPGDEITAVFDWGNAMAGDPLYDIAWIVYCIPWFPAIDRRQVLDLARRHFPDDDLDRLLPLYEMHIAVASLQYMAFADDLDGLAKTPGWIERLVSTVRDPRAL
jgi:hygromycin-B 4-O-kinase